MLRQGHDKYTLPLFGLDHDNGQNSIFFVNGVASKTVKLTPRERALKQQARVDKIQSLFDSHSSRLQSSQTHEAPPFAIDAVFTWVSNTAVDVLKRQQYEMQQPSGRPSDNENNRYDDNDELRYAIRSIYQHAPWFRHIYIIVDDAQCPEWLIAASDTAPIPTIIVPHSFLYGEEFRDHLPTFNSHSIECHLHRIPGLSEQFVYFNDDMYVNRSVPWSQFFGANGHPIYNFTGLVPTGPRHVTMTKHTIAWINNGTVLDQIFPNTSNSCRKYPAHQCIAMLKSSFEQVWANDTLCRYMTTTSRSRFRNTNNLYPIGFMCYWNIYTNHASEQSYPTLFIQVTDDLDIYHLSNSILISNPALLCLNDGLQKKHTPSMQLVAMLMSKLFPIPSPVEFTTSEGSL